MAHFTNSSLAPVLQPQFIFDQNLVLLSLGFQPSDRYKIIYMARQLCCRGMSNNSSVGTKIFPIGATVYIDINNLPVKWFMFFSEMGNLQAALSFCSKYIHTRLYVCVSACK